MRTKYIILLALIIFPLSSIPFIYGQSSSYPSLFLIDFDIKKAYNENKNGKYISDYIDYRVIPTYKVNPDGLSRDEALPWEATPANLNYPANFDWISIDKSQRGKIFTFDGVQVELLEMEHSSVHLKLETNYDSSWDFIPCNNGQPMSHSLSLSTYPFTFYDFARKNRGFSYEDFEKRAAANAKKWHDYTGHCCITIDFYCPVTSLYIYKQHISGEKGVGIKKNGKK